MLERVEIKNPARTPVPWWNKVELLQAFTEFRFTPGLNVIWGPNGSGKSTLLTLSAHLTHSKAGGRSVVTAESVGALDDYRRGGLQDGAEVYLDGQAVLYFSPQDSIGLIGGMAGFDYDFMDEGMASIQHNSISSGQSATAKLGQVLQNKGKPVEWKYTFDKERKPEAFAFMERQLSCRCAAGPQTILMDEPDANLDWTNKLQWWNMFHRATVAGKFQFIIATHSPFGLRCPGANYIDLQAGYREDCAAALQQGGLWSDDWGTEL